MFNQVRLHYLFKNYRFSGIPTRNGETAFINIRFARSFVPECIFLSRISDGDRRYEVDSLSARSTAVIAQCVELL